MEAHGFKNILPDAEANASGIGDASHGQRVIQIKIRRIRVRTKGTLVDLIIIESSLLNSLRCEPEAKGGRRLLFIGRQLVCARFLASDAGRLFLAGKYQKQTITFWRLLHPAATTRLANGCR